MDEDSFKLALKGARIPVLVLDQKWHRLFALSGKPEEIKELETELNELLARQGKLTTEIKELKKLKNKLMQGIVANMETSKDGKLEKSVNLDQNKKLIEETNQKIEEDEDELLDLPPQIKEKNEELMMETMKFTYEKLRSNTNEVKDIANWIAQVRVDLKKNIIKKQNREINNREIYAYMHDIFGKDVINIFDIKNDVEIALVSKDSAGASPGQDISDKTIDVEPKKETVVKEKPTENFDAQMLKPGESPGGSDNKKESNDEDEEDWDL
ncbi:MAG: hypothetical protein K6F00_04700 [Lachnospiraceae bacterium]|nr:hypothetical protein [Lachnospiraceae bacterium]